MFEIAFKEAAKSSPSIVKSVLPKKYSIESFQVAIVGELVNNDPEKKGLFLKTKSGQLFTLGNRVAKDDKDKPEDVVKKLTDAATDGKTLGKVEGSVVEDKDGNLTIQMEKGDAAAPPAPEEKK